MLNTIHDPKNVQLYYTEYLNLLKYYANIKRPSVFVKYFNINRDLSVFDSDLETTFDIYNSGLRFDVYDFTPCYYLTPLVNISVNVPDGRGQSMDAQTSIVIYTIEFARIYDLVMFYEPVKSGEIFRVVNLKTPVNALHSSVPLTWYELDLEYAPIIDINSLHLANHYVYDLSQEKYITYNEYKNFLKKIQGIESKLDIIKPYYDSYYDLYKVDNYVPAEVNELIIYLKRQYNTKYRRLLDNYNLPYGYLDKLGWNLNYSSLEQIPFTLENSVYHIYNVRDSSVLNYEWNYTQGVRNNFERVLAASYELYQLLRT